MKKLSTTILFLFLMLAFGEIWLFQAKGKYEYWKALNAADSSLAITPQILILRRNFQAIQDRKGIATLPLGSLSNARIVFCEESNGMIAYRSDRFGFRNPDQAWDQDVAIAVVGDSFAQGACVPDGSDVPSQLRLHFGNVLNMGSVGNGPLANLAVISEYLRTKKPKRILWFYVANDLGIDLPYEAQTQLLASYRHPGFTQSLVHRQADLDDVIANFLNEEAEFETKRPRLPKWLSLTNTQNALTKLAVRTLRLDSARQGFDMDYAKRRGLKFEGMAEAIRIARHLLPETQFRLVIVPDAGMFSPEHKAAVKQHIARLEHMAARLQIESIDLRSAFRDVPQPLDYYAVKFDGTYGHYTPEGYRLVSDYLISALNKGQARAGN